MKIINVLVDEMPSGCKRCNFCVAKMYCSLLEDRKTTAVFQCEKCGTIVDECVLNTCPIEDALNKRIAELEAAQRWIPVSERLPEDDDEVLISIDGEVFYCYYEEISWRYGKSRELIPCHSFIIINDGASFDEGRNFPSHWMPLPEPAGE